MKLTHTPGPWAHIVRNWEIVASGISARAIADIPHHDASGMADAILIASTPDMLGLLKRAAHVLAESDAHQEAATLALRSSIVEIIKHVDPAYYGSKS